MEDKTEYDGEREREGGRKNALGPNTRVLPRNVLPNGAQCQRQI